MPVRVGIDMVTVGSVEESLRTHAGHYLARVFTDREVEDCGGPAGPDPQRLAARFAAKEATLKVLRPGDRAVPWRAIEVRRDPAGWVELALEGNAAALAAEAGVADLALSLTHEPTFASAVVVAELTSSGPTELPIGET